MINESCSKCHAKPIVITEDKAIEIRNSDLYVCLEPRLREAIKEPLKDGQCYGCKDLTLAHCVSLLFFMYKLGVRI